MTDTGTTHGQDQLCTLPRKDVVVYPLHANPRLSSYSCTLHVRIVPVGVTTIVLAPLPYRRRQFHPRLLRSSVYPSLCSS